MLNSYHLLSHTMQSANKKDLGERLLSVDEACEFLQISVPTFYRLRKEGKLKAVRVGGGIRIDPTELRSFIARNVSKRTGER